MKQINMRNVKHHSKKVEPQPRPKGTADDSLVPKQEPYNGNLYHANLTV